MKELSNVFVTPNGLSADMPGISKHGYEIIGVIPVKDVPIGKLHLVHQFFDIEFKIDGHFFTGHDKILFI